MKRLSAGQIVILTVLVGILILTIVWATSVWNTGEAVMDKHGWIALGLGTFFSLLIGCGLMALMFLAAAGATMMRPTHSGDDPRPRNEATGQVEARSDRESRNHPAFRGRARSVFGPNQ